MFYSINNKVINLKKIVSFSLENNAIRFYYSIDYVYVGFESSQLAEEAFQKLLNVLKVQNILIN